MYPASFIVSVVDSETIGLSCEEQECDWEATFVTGAFIDYLIVEMEAHNQVHLVLGLSDG